MAYDIGLLSGLHLNKEHERQELQVKHILLCPVYNFLFE